MRSKLWPFKKAENPAPSTTDDKFLIDMESSSNLSKTKTMLKKMGAVSIKEVKEESEKQSNYNIINKLYAYFVF